MKYVNKTIKNVLPPIKTLNKSHNKSNEDPFLKFKNLNDSLLEKIYDIFKYDFILFGYKVPLFMKKFT